MTICNLMLNTFFAISQNIHLSSYDIFALNRRIVVSAISPSRGSKDTILYSFPVSCFLVQNSEFDVPDIAFGWGTGC